MHNMPNSAVKYYKMWISTFPESWHQNDFERFYMFVSVLVRRCRKQRTRYWLERNMKEDRPKLTDESVERYCNLFEHLRDYTLVWKSQQSMILLQDEQAENMKR